MLVMADHL